jgi:ubiquinone/menaquinone biosynthesis C-methylase UbiE
VKELGSTYVVQDRNNQEELKRLIVQDRVITDAMGGVLPEQQDTSRFRRVLDIGCGPGGWILLAAQTYPQIEKLYGIDISTAIINYAKEQAAQQNVANSPKERIEFLVMDALRMLEFPDDFFDLVNLRFGISFMRQWDWPKMFNEMNRVAKPGAIVRIVEGTIGSNSSSKALGQFYTLFQRAMYRAGHLFKEDAAGLIDELPSLLVRHGFNKLEVQRQEIAYRTGTEIGDDAVKDVLHLFHTIRPYLRRYGCEPKDYDEICKQATQDMQQPDFVMISPITTIWAANPKERTGLNYDPSTID